MNSWCSWPSTSARADHVYVAAQRRRPRCNRLAGERQRSWGSFVFARARNLLGHFWSLRWLGRSEGYHSGCPSLPAFTLFVISFTLFIILQAVVLLFGQVGLLGGFSAPNQASLPSPGDCPLGVRLVPFLPRGSCCSSWPCLGADGARGCVRSPPAPSGDEQAQGKVQGS